MRLLLFLLFLVLPASAQTRIEVDVELFLAVDASRSMQPFELEIQRRGYAAALTSPEVQGAIARGPLGRIAITYVEWAGEGDQRVIVPWTLASAGPDLTAIANSLLSNFDAGLRRTSISSVLDHAALSMEINNFEGLRRVIDVSGDGPNNSGDPVTQARDRVVAQGITINGLPLLTKDETTFAWWDIPDLDTYYEACVIGGLGAFVLPVTNWAEFEDAVRRKLVLEIAGLPERIYKAQARPPYNCLIGEDIWQRNRLIFSDP